jgi:dolichol-phosphate mannosyltransferase
VKSLCVIMPIYNEEASIEKTFLEWHEAFEQQQFFRQVKFVLINDGSKDNTLPIIRGLAAVHKGIHVIDKPNSGHGHSCFVGYQYAVEQNYEYTMQLDSDGQCDPRFFPAFLEKIENHDIVYGFRYIRRDGFLRFLISRILSVVAFVRTGIWVWDPNCPYRIFKTDTIREFVQKVDPTFILINVVLALSHKRMGMKLVNIVFRERHGGSPSLNTMKLIKVGREFDRQLKYFKAP